MGRFAQRWSAEQKAAVIAAVCDEKMSAPDCAKVAREHGLSGLEPFPIPVATIRDLRQKENRKRKGKSLTPLAQSPPKQAFEILLRRQLAAIERAQDYYDRGQKAKPDLKAIGELAQVAAKVYDLLSKVTGKEAPTHPPGHPAKRKDLEKASGTEQERALLREMERDAPSNGATNGSTQDGEQGPGAGQESNGKGTTDGETVGVEAFSPPPGATDPDLMPTALQPE